MARIQRHAICAFAATALTLSWPLHAQRGRGAGPGAHGGVAGIGAPPVNLPPPGSAMGTHQDQRRSTAAIGLQNNAALSTRARTMLPPGSSVSTAAAGFHSEQDFLAALHASKSLNIPFDQVKSKMTEGQGLSLDKTIRALRPDLDKGTVKQSVRSAQQMARDDMRTAKQENRGSQPGGESAAAAQIRMNPALAARVAPMLPDGVSLDQASAGFRSTGQFVAALHASKSLGIPFSELRARMIAGGESLGEAIHGVRPALSEASINEAVQSAEQSARIDVRAGSSAAVSSSTTHPNQ